MIIHVICDKCTGILPKEDALYVGKKVNIRGEIVKLFNCIGCAKETNETNQIKKES